MKPDPTPIRDAKWWRAEARMSAEDGHPDAAVAAMAEALLLDHPELTEDEWREHLRAYREMVTT